MELNLISTGTYVLGLNQVVWSPIFINCCLRNTLSLHRHQILGYAVFGDVTTDPMSPGIHFGRVWRRKKRRTI